MVEAVTPPNSDQSNSGKHSNPLHTIPDPTLMTIDALRREIAMLESHIDTKLKSANRLEEERCRRIDALMNHAESLRKEQKADTRSAVEAALGAQEEATHKMEKSISDQLASLRSNFETAIQSVQGNIADLKDRMTALESVRQGASDQRTERRQVTSGQLTTLGIGIALAMALLSLISFLAGTGV